MKAISLFAGIGGACVGLQMAGHEIISAVEFDSSNSKFSDFCQHSYSINFPQSKFWLSQVQQTITHLPSCDILQLSPPCTRFSQAGKIAALTESCLDKEIAIAISKTIAKLEPEYIFMEQVPQYVNSESFGIILLGLGRLGYHVKTEISNYSDYGVAQSRIRLSLVASKQPILRKSSNYRRMGWKEAIAGVELEPCKLTPRQTAAVCKRLDKDNLDWESGLLIQRIGLNTSIRTSLQPAPTITRSMFCDGKGNERSRVLTVIDSRGVWNLPIKAIARLCGFPDWFWLGKKSGEGLGYAVCPQFMKRFTQEFI